jgi:anti-sigma-K factor RskA
MARSELPDNGSNNWQDLTAGYVLGNLSDEEIESWERLVQQYPELCDEIKQFQSTFNVLAETVPMYPPSGQLLNQIRAAAKVALDTKTVPSPVQSPTLLRRASDRTILLMRWGGAIAASVMAVLAVQTVSLRAQLQQAKTQIANLDRKLQEVQQQAQSVPPVVNTLQQPETLIYSLEGSDLANTAAGRLILSRQQEIIIVVQNLPELPEGEVYRLWADLPKETELTYCGQFNSNTQGLIQLTPSRQCGEDPTQMIITLDAITDPTTRGGPVVMQGRI